MIETLHGLILFNRYEIFFMANLLKFYHLQNIHETMIGCNS